MAPSQAELTAQHYPRRPDPIGAAAAYAGWLANVTQTFQLAAPRPVIGAGFPPAGLLGSAVYSDNWGGPVMTHLSGEVYQFVSGSYTAPYFTNSSSIIERPNTSYALPDYDSQWVSFYGYTTAYRDITNNNYAYWYLEDPTYSYKLENNYQPGENHQAPIDNNVFWQYIRGNQAY
jgi:hypothetical protein